MDASDPTDSQNLNSLASEGAVHIWMPVTSTGMTYVGGIPNTVMPGGGWRPSPGIHAFFVGRTHDVSARWVGMTLREEG